MMEEHPSLSLAELNALVRQSVRTCLPDTYWVRAELSDVRFHTSGHCYLEFVQKEPKGNSLVAKARGIIWSSVVARLRPFFERETGQPLVAGLQVLVRVTVDFHELYGYSLTVVDIDPTYTLGDMARRRKEILRRLDEEGILTLNKELPFPILPQRIAVISSATAAGYGDFCHQLAHNPFGFVFHPRLFPAVMQGDRVEASVIHALEQVYELADCFDVVVIIRGGGATSDLSGFDTYLLAAHCAQFPLPIVTGIGHERDDTVIDLIAHTRVKTPTAAAERLVEVCRQTALRLDALRDYIYKVVPERLEREKSRLDTWLVRVPARVQMSLQQESFRQERLSRRLLQAGQARMAREEHRLQVMPRIVMAGRARLLKEGHRLDLLAQQVAAASPERLLQKGYSITWKDGKVVTSTTRLQPGDELVTQVADGTFKSRVI